MSRRMLAAALILLALVGASGCTPPVEPFSVSHVDRSVSHASLYPTAVDVQKIGKYSGGAKSGAGYFYDDVLEYRVWLHPENGAEPLAGNEDYFAAFAEYEPALEYSRSHKGAEAPLVLIRQVESINEPSPGVFEWIKEERITEYFDKWLQDGHREPDSIPRFLQQHAPTQR